MLDYRIQNKQNVHFGGPKTCFEYYEKQGDAYVFQGRFFLLGWNASDEKCAAFAAHSLAEDQG